MKMQYYANAMIPSSNSRVRIALNFQAASNYAKIRIGVTT